MSNGEFARTIEFIRRITEPAADGAARRRHIPCYRPPGFLGSPPLRAARHARRSSSANDSGSRRPRRAWHADAPPGARAERSSSNGTDCGDQKPRVAPPRLPLHADRPRAFPSPAQRYA